MNIIVQLVLYWIKASDVQQWIWVTGDTVDAKQRAEL